MCGVWMLLLWKTLLVVGVVVKWQSGVEGGGRVTRMEVKVEREGDAMARDFNSN